MPPVVVVGAGAAGAMAAIFAAGSGRRVILLERTSDGGRKILISGGGRCNVLPSEVNPSRFVTASSPNSLKKMLLSWPLEEQRHFFEETLGIPLTLEKETGKLFPASNRARDVRDGLLDEARKRGAEIWVDRCVTDVRPGEAGGWVIGFEGGEVLRAGAVVLATGGLSVPKTGSDGIGLQIARRLGHMVNDTYPALTPLIAEPPRHAELAGISLRVSIHAPANGRGPSSQGGFLFTHRGYSGPAVLDLSHLAVRSRLARSAPQPLHVQWTDLDDAGWDRELRQAGSGTVGSTIRPRLPTRLADTLVRESNVDLDRSLATLRREERARLVANLARYVLPWTGDEGYRKAEVTGGGVALREVDPATLESRVAPGLFLCGEILDAFGPIGGYNFLWSWATGRAAGRGAARLIGASA
jgi:predicted Rossmann fold flavoprotein